MDFESYVPIITDYGIRIVGVLIGLWVAFKIGAWLGNRLTRTLQQKNFDETLARFFGTLVRWTIITASILAVLSIFGIETTSFAAIIGAAGLAIGLAFQGTLGNFAAGVMLLVFRPFKVGDLITAGGETGIVHEIGLFVTALDTPDNRRIILPNSAAAGGTITNMTFHEMRRVDVEVGAEYSADIDATRAALEKAAASVPGRDPEKGHQIFLAGLGGSSVDWQVRVWGDPAAYWDIYQATIQATKRELDAAGIGIPFPQMDVHLDK